MKTKILIKVDSSVGYIPTLEGVCSAFSSINDGIYIWDAKVKPAYDVFYECRPEILICMDKTIDTSLSNVLKEYKDTKVIAIGPEVPDYFKPDLTCYPGASGEKSYDLQPAANLVDYAPASAKDKYKSEISTISDNESPIINSLSSFSLKSFSYTRKLKYPNYIGKILPNEIPSILSSCALYLDTDGHNDLLLSAMANSCPCLSANETTLSVDYIPKAASLEELITCIKAIMLKKSFREEHVEKCYRFVMEGHTYFHRASDMFSLLGYKEYSESCLSKLEEYA
tara:strand:+ start:886 stop:1734 length:849 start_codon:yes stop_codon:yes gene_type:complete